MISVIIPTYKSPSVLDLCLNSAINSQHYKNEIIVVVDGTYEINKDVLKKYSNSIEILNLEKNQGTCKAINLGVYNAANEDVLIVNDDNVFPRMWDVNLLEIKQDNCVITPNQIEPYPSMFQQFIIEDLGKTPDEFELEKFWKYESDIKENKIDSTGSTFPFFISKYNFLRVGGFDSDYPSKAGFVADWDFFMKCEMSNMKMIRTYNCNFYHFVSVSSKMQSEINKSRMEEANCHTYFKYKWGVSAEHNAVTNSKLIKKYHSNF